MPLYKYVTVDTAIRILNGSIRFTQPSAFNDPFELLPQFITPESFMPESQTLNICCVSLRRKGLDRRKVKEVDKYKSDIQARQIVSSLNGVVGLLCLTKNSESLLMWGHYAEEYHGAIIEFDEGHEFFNGQIPVLYKKNRPIYDFSDFYGEKFPIADLCVKPNDWSYEREVRVARPLSMCKKNEKVLNGHPVMTMDIPLDCIRSVTMGERMPLEGQKKIWELVKDTHVGLSLAAISNWEYKFRTEAIKYQGKSGIMSPVVTPRTAGIFKDDPGHLGDLARWLEESHPASGFVNLRV